MERQNSYNELTLIYMGKGFDDDNDADELMSHEVDLIIIFLIIDG